MGEGKAITWDSKPGWSTARLSDRSIWQLLCGTENDYKLELCKGVRFSSWPVPLLERWQERTLPLATSLPPPKNSHATDRQTREHPVSLHWLYQALLGRQPTAYRTHGIWEVVSCRPWFTIPDYCRPPFRMEECRDRGTRKCSAFGSWGGVPTSDPHRDHSQIAVWGRGLQAGLILPTHWLNGKKNTSWLENLLRCFRRLKKRIIAVKNYMRIVVFVL